jgi:ATP-dependent Clp protease protease subunit
MPGDEQQIQIVRMPLRDVHDLGVDVQRRDIWATGEMGLVGDSDYVGWFATALRYLESISHDPITVWLSTNGGSTDTSRACYDLIQACAAPVRVIGYGMVASAGVLVLAGGEPGMRLVTEHCLVMAHEMVPGLEEGTPMGLAEVQIAEARWEEENWCELMARHTKHAAGYWRRLVKENREKWYLGGEAAVEAGIADAVWRGGAFPGEEGDMPVGVRKKKKSEKGKPWKIVRLRNGRPTGAVEGESLTKADAQASARAINEKHRG